MTTKLTQSEFTQLERDLDKSWEQIGFETIIHWHDEGRAVTVRTWVHACLHHVLNDPDPRDWEFQELLKTLDVDELEEALEASCVLNHVAVCHARKTSTHQAK